MVKTSPAGHFPLDLALTHFKDFGGGEKTKAVKSEQGKLIKWYCPWSLSQGVLDLAQASLKRGTGSLSASLWHN